MFAEARIVNEQNKPVANKSLLRKNGVLYDGIRAFRKLYLAKFELWEGGTIQLPGAVSSKFVPSAEIGYSDPFPEWFPIFTEKRSDHLDDEGENGRLFLLNMRTVYDEGIVGLTVCN
jgi:hypothetical protein